MPSLNNCQFMGHLGQDPELRYMASGSNVCTFSLACTEKWKDKNTGQQQKHTEWVRFTVFGQRADVVAKYCKKGDPLYAAGRMRTRKWQDQSGHDRWTTEILVDRVEFLKPKDNNQYPAQPAQTAAPQQGGFDDDIPFARKSYYEGG